MNSRERILQTVKQNKPAYVPLPSVYSFVSHTENLLATFTNALTAVGGFCKLDEDLELLEAFIFQQKEKGVRVIVGVEGIQGYNLDEVKNSTGLELQDVDTVVIKGAIAVAENGAVWVTDGCIGNRILPFISQHLIIVIDQASICANMHEAYKRITIDNEGYGVFIAGPSKTADIEQSLVVGAHGPLSLQVYVY